MVSGPPHRNRGGDEAKAAYLKAWIQMMQEVKIGLQMENAVSY